MIRKHPAQFALGFLLLGGCASIGEPPSRLVASAVLQAGDGSPAGTAALVAKGDGLELHLDAKGLPAGQHGAHLHAIGNCAVPGFASAGPHLNPYGRMHGMMNPQGHHLGDLPNLAVGADGKASLTARLEGTRAELDPILFDSDGTAIVIHATADDLRTDPSGNSGARLACGVFKKAG